MKVTETARETQEAAGLRHPDVVVVGTGRSGTSFTAYVLQELLGVCMAHDFDPPTKMVAGGYPYRVGGYEERGLLRVTERFAASRPGTVPWLERFGRVHEGCTGLVGVKQWRLARAKREHWEMLAPRLVVRTFRMEEPTVRSMTRFRRPHDPEYWRRFYWELETNMRTVIDGSYQTPSKRWSFPCPVVVVDFSQGRISEEALAEKLRPHVEELAA
ncbi:MAG: hypothetical protein GY769_07705 [bacterium]|nr:hypothetical protein [bacterium]